MYCTITVNLKHYWLFNWYAFINSIIIHMFYFLLCFRCQFLLTFLMLPLWSWSKSPIKTTKRKEKAKSDDRYIVYRCLWKGKCSHHSLNITVRISSSCWLENTIKKELFSMIIVWKMLKFKTLHSSLISAFKTEEFFRIRIILNNSHYVKLRKQSTKLWNAILWRPVHSLLLLSQ